ncbi:amino acid ABC transporter permease [Haloglycomyces albus]|uniref:amino acid ABC transporter permease n=1 Tax=Haloglycomyces albus TaxID=526067 RepID=UPI00046D7CFC|nr:amino acid ABC transporter permease [Haloglycomyces albus]
MTDWDNEAAKNVFPYVWEGFLVVLQIAVWSALLATVLGLLAAIALQIAPRWAAATISGVMQFIRNTPLLVQVLLVFTFTSTVLNGLNLTAMVVGAIVLGVHYSSYVMESFRAGIEAIPKGQWEAATALSLPRTHTWRTVIGPQMLKRSLPSVTNWLVAMFKEVPVLTAIGVMEMIARVREYASISYVGGIEGYTMAGLLFLVASYPIALASRRLEIRLAKSNF